MYNKTRGENSLIKKKYYNNGIINKMIPEGDPIPEGFVPGMKKRSQSDIEASNIKRKQTCQDKYGGSAPLCSKEILEKSKKTNLKRYGVENPLQSEEIKEKVKKTNINKYGVENPMYYEEFKDRLKKTNLERYGTENPFASEEIKEKIKHTNIERYGVEYAITSQEVKDRAYKTNLEKFGDIYPTKTKEIKEKTRQTNIKRYGVSSVLQSPEIKQKAKNTLLKHYGVENPMYSDEIREKIYDTNLKKYGTRYTFQSEDIKDKVSQTCQEKYGVPWACMRPEARMSYSNNSGPNKNFAKLLEDNNIQYEREFHIGSYSYDFKIGNTLIEINPSATHNIIWSPFGDTKITEIYHKNKSEIAEKEGYRCIHVFDWDDKSKIVKLLKNKEVIYARKTIVQEVSDNELIEFENENHLQGYCKGQTIKIGLYYNNKLVSIMTFGKPRYNKGYEYELLRYCSSSNIIGGAQKLFKYFISNYNPKSIISYCDNSKFSGKVYKDLGFKIKSKGYPSCHWFNVKYDHHITDNLLRQHGFDQLFNTSYGKGTSNEELVIQAGYLPIYDCGQSTYIFNSVQ